MKRFIVVFWVVCFFVLLGTAVRAVAGDGGGQPPEDYNYFPGEILHNADNPFLLYIYGDVTGFGGVSVSPVFLPRGARLLPLGGAY